MMFKALMFDFDGTITRKGVFHPDKEMVQLLAEVAQERPIACCTGRQLESFITHGLDYFMDGVSEEMKPNLLKNLHLMAENGAIGYNYNVENEQFEEFYRTEWPEEFYSREKLMDELNEAIKEFGSIYYNAHRVVVVLRTKIHNMTDKDIKLVYELSDKIYEVATKFLEKVDPDYQKYLHVGNSGIGVIIGPAQGDKNMGIKQFAEFLAKSRGWNFKENAREILVVGDRPMIGGNDHYFLNGEFGTAYTVGALMEGAEFPLPVLDQNGERLFHADGTMYLIREKLLTF